MINVKVNIEIVAYIDISKFYMYNLLPSILDLNLSTVFPVCILGLQLQIFHQLVMQLSVKCLILLHFCFHFSALEADPVKKQAHALLMCSSNKTQHIHMHTHNLECLEYNIIVLKTYAQHISLEELVDYQ